MRLIEVVVYFDVFQRFEELEGWVYLLIAGNRCVRDAIMYGTVEAEILS